MNSPECHLGQGLNLPLNFVTEAAAILGVRGSGKTNTAVVGAEELLKHGQQVVVIDPTNVWHGIRSSRDGNAPGFPVLVFGGPNGDLPLTADNGNALAEFLVRHRHSAVLCVRHLSKGGMRRFITDFATRLYELKGETEHRTPVQVIIDEAHLFVPQTVRGDVAVMVGAIDDLVRLGRSSGIGTVLISQRAATVNKDVLSQCETLFVHRHTGPQDRKALDEWLQSHDVEGKREEFLSTLASLKLGQCWLWSPFWLDRFDMVQIRQRDTFDSSRTPEVGERAIVPKALAKIDLDALKAALAESIDLSAASDPKALKARIKELEAQISKGGNIDVDGLRSENAGLRKEVAESNRANQVLRAAASDLRTRLGMAVSGLGRIIAATNALADDLAGDPLPVTIVGETGAETGAEGNPSSLIVKADPQLKPYAAPTDQAQEERPLSKPQQLMVDVVKAYTLSVKGSDGISRELLAIFSRQSFTSSGFKENLRQLRSRDVLIEHGGAINLSPSASTDGWLTGERPEISLKWLHVNLGSVLRLSKPQQSIVAKLIAAKKEGKAFDRATLAAATNTTSTSSGYKENVRQLKAKRLIIVTGDVVQVAELLFPKGLK